MKLRIGEIELHLDYDSEFSEKVSVLRKKDRISFSSYIYVTGSGIESNRRISYIKDLKESPSAIYASKAEAYFWIFEGCELISKSVEKDENYRSYSLTEEVHASRWLVKIEVSYKDVFGTSKPNVVKREIALNDLFGRD